MLGFGRSKRLEAQVEQLQTELAEIKTAQAQNAIKLTDMEGWQDLLGMRTFAGPTVNADTAMRASAVFSCVRLIAGAVACSPLIVYRGRRTNRSRGERAQDHALAEILAAQPCPEMTAGTFWRAMTQHKLLSGNAYAVINRTRGGEVQGLTPVRPSRVQPYQAWQIGLDKRLGVSRWRLYYYVTLADGSQVLLDQDDMLHVPNLGWDDCKGLSTISFMAQAVGSALAADESAGRFFANGMQTDKAIRYPKALTAEAQERLRDMLQRRYSGAANSGLPLVLTEGGEVQSLSMSARDAQLIESREFSVVDICRWFGVPPVMVGESSKTTSWGSGVEQMAKWFATFTLNDHFTAFEQELDRKLFRDGLHFPEFDEAELTRGDTKTRFDAHRIARGSLQEPGIKTVNEIRAEEGYPPVEGGDTLYRPDPNASKAGGAKEKQEPEDPADPGRWMKE